MRIIVTCTTIPSRMPYLFDVVDSIVHQSRKPDAFYIALPRYSPKEKCLYPLLDERFSQWIESGKLQVLKCQQDYGPISKLIPALIHETDPATLIITIDDDRRYDCSMLETFEKYATRHPCAALSGAGWILGSFPCAFVSIRNHPTCVSVDSLQASDACAYRRGMFHVNDLLKLQKQFGKDGFLMDDVVVSGYLALNHIDRFVVPMKRGVSTDANFMNALSRSPGFIMSNVRLAYKFKSLGCFNRPTQFKFLLNSYAILAIIIVLGALFLLGVLFYIIFIYPCRKKKMKKMKSLYSSSSSHDTNDTPGLSDGISPAK